ncbi:MAG: type III pantothenate kinase [Saprospiraceae bacterium]|nr:type III pantothenate kinase [Saprospiraceae bacterium]MCF8250984.1 type III pantothenate kinase [Saprospiraceae bacterium]MCF8280313.1 type III pantothenate kinase [Bacteroidales bacterium]MCF8312840.1 type III pantothenate kinase [Saprospiraceae bacterium]MCF8441287.1 type III pantothenate kinase [Saprospiraceae bacterium]
MNLAIDIGNTRTKIAVFDGDELLHKEVWSELTLPEVKQLAYNQKVEKIILSSVSKQSEEVMSFLKTNFTFLELTTETALPIRIRYKTPETLGKDRIAAAAGAAHLFPQKFCLVIDAGTCITLDVVSSEGEFLGGNISPGIEMRLKAMHHFTARLPQVVRTANRPDELGDSTENAIRNGGEMGALLEVEGFIRLCRKKYRPLRVVLTGGDADFFVKHTKTKIFAHQNLVLLGLNQILQHNAKLFEGF